MRSIRYRRGTKKYRHSKRKERKYAFFTTTILCFGTLNKNCRIYDKDGINVNLNSKIKEIKERAASM